MSAVRAVVGFLLCLGLAVGTARAQSETLGDVTIGVAAFERVGPPGSSIPDVAQLLADRFGVAGVGRVVGPAQLGAPADPDPAPAAVQSWAKKAAVSYVVSGRTTRLGPRISVDVRLRANNGAAVSTHVAEADEQGLELAVDGLASEILRKIVAGTRVPAVASAPPSRPRTAAVAAPAAAPAPAAPEASEADVERAKDEGAKDKGFFGFDAANSKDPISIRSDELEAFQNEKTRRFIFKRNVRVEQGDILLTSDKLEAFYPADASEPDTLVASGHVRMSQNDRKARCKTLTYYRKTERIVCRGEALMQQGDDKVTGEEIEFHLRTERLFVRGGADVHFKPKDEEEDASPPAPAPGAGAGAGADGEAG